MLSQKAVKKPDLDQINLKHAGYANPRSTKFSYFHTGENFAQLVGPTENTAGLTEFLTYQQVMSLPPLMI